MRHHQRQASLHQQCQAPVRLRVQVAIQVFQVHLQRSHSESHATSNEIPDGNTFIPPIRCALGNTQHCCLRHTLGHSLDVTQLQTLFDSLEYALRCPYEFSFSVNNALLSSF